MTGVALAPCGHPYSKTMNPDHAWECHECGAFAWKPTRLEGALALLREGLSLDMPTESGTNEFIAWHEKVDAFLEDISKIEEPINRWVDGL